MEIKNAIIDNVRIEIEDHRSLTVWVTLDYGGTGQGFGGYALYLPKNFTHHELKSVAGHFIYRVLEIAGVDRWDSLSGKTVRALCDHNRIEAIGHITKDDWFNPSKDFEEVK